MKKVVKCKPVDMAERQFNLVEVLFGGDTLTCWMELKCVETTCISKKLVRMDKPARGICKDTYKMCLQELKKHYFPKNSALLQKAYLRSHVKKPNKLFVENTTAQLREICGMLMHFSVPRNTPMAEDELCGIIYQMIKQD
eukprot:11162153-Ditylum_brightwellii.AAC.1